MLSPHDADLARRDPTLPGLATLLDPDAFAGALRAALPDAGVLSAAPTYVRYKPGTNCLVAYTANLAGGTVDLYAVAYRRDDPDRLAKPVERPSAPALQGGGALPGQLVLRDEATVVSFFPNDGGLRTLSRLAEPEAWRALLRRMSPDRPDLWDAEVSTLAYKPERRYVARVDTEAGPQVVMKFYTENGYPRARVNAKAFKSQGVLQVPRRTGHSDRHRLLAFEWMGGRLLSDALMEPGFDLAEMERVGAALAEVHAQDPDGIDPLSREAEASSLLSAAAGLAFLCPRIAGRVERLARDVAARLVKLPPVVRPAHGDFYAGQVLLSDGHVVVLDFDSAFAGDPAADLGLFAAHLERGELRGTVPRGMAGPVGDALLAGYDRAAGTVDRRRVGLYAAAGLLSLAPHAFRSRQPGWPEATEAIIARAERALSEAAGGSASRPCAPDTAVIPVSDPFGAAHDPSMPFAPQALSPADVLPLLRRVPLLADAELRAIRVARYKPGRRCLVEYDLNGPAGALTLVGKMRARGLDRNTYDTLRTLRQAGFHDESGDGISVPEPVGVVPELQMWLQRKVAGQPATHLLAGPDGVAFAGRIAEAAHRLHRSGVRPRRTHTMADELRILRERLPLVAADRPEWAGRIARLLDKCDRLGASVPRVAPTGIHRDFYADNVLVDGPRLYLLDLDLYCHGDPGLDIGNFLAHIKEYSLRAWGDPDRLSSVEQALEERFVELSGEGVRASVRAYTTLALVRHIHLSTLFERRRHTTGALLELCEERLPGDYRLTAAPEVTYRAASTR
ncbi:MAG TPA: phosphotransferase [Chloroflexia bacterium]|nr:phosphotransferase [Chloroflexia bacterium]